MPMHNPPHPGGIFKRQCLEPMGLTAAQAAHKLDVSVEALLALVNERAGITTELASRLAEVFGSRAKTWLGMQKAHDLWQARSGTGNRDKLPVRPLAG